MSSRANIAHKLLTERRASVRFPCQLVVTCRPAGGSEGNCSHATVKNVSSSGLGMIAEVAIAPGTFLTVEFHPQTKIGSLVAEVHVLHVRPEGDARWYHRCRFVTPLDNSDLDALLR